MTPSALSARNRRALLIAGVVLGLGLTYLLLLEPLQHQIEVRRAGLQSTQNMNRWLRQVAGESQALRVNTAAGALSDNRSLLALVDETARAAGLAAAIGEMAPDGQDQLRLTLTRVNFDALMQWLVELDQHRITVASILVSRGDQPGEAQATLTLRDGR